ncbi:654_t:CDS:2 [Acaulospora morrowiae]|uniref:654_t:CDS:1 n=1 Tax=Acaulospora morrowiae TaxID=94023 RepID=A0A9N8YZJ9_9GLOM|nr:654_t:CDS:2 [Acaulospora morrowiae]
MEGSHSFKKEHDKCPGCKNLDQCTDCYSEQFLPVNSGNFDIDNLIKATHRNNIRYRLEWIPFEDFTDVQEVEEGGFSIISTAIWIKGRVTSYSGGKLNRKGRMKIILKVLKDSQNINSAFIKELHNIAKTQPNSPKRYVVHYYGVSQDPITKNYIFVMDYMKNGSLHDYLSKNFDEIKWMDWRKTEIY